MTQIIKRALPFVLAFVFGLTCTAIFRSLVPSRRTSRVYDVSWSHCRYKERKNVAVNQFVPMNQDGMFDVTEMQYSGAIGHSFVSLSPGSALTGLTAKESALVISGGSTFGSRNTLVVSYVSPDTLDGLPVTSDAELIDVPRPAFWRDEETEWKAHCGNTMARVELDRSGVVSNVDTVPVHGEACAYIGDVVDAARKIKFTPALRDGTPVSQRISILYTLR